MEADGDIMIACPRLNSLLIRFAEWIGRLGFGRDVRVVPTEQLPVLEYRKKLRDAAAANDYGFLRAELERNQLTDEDFARLEHQILPGDQWPDDEVPMADDVQPQDSACAI
jgi:hypothetical protein